VQAPTNEQDIVLETIDRLQPQRGTSIGQGILTSLDVILRRGVPPPKLYSNLTPTPEPAPVAPARVSDGSAVIVLLTDGENNQRPDPLAAAQAASEVGVRIYTVGIGSAQGTTLEVNGFSVFTQLDEGLLQNIAQLTQGAYYRAENQDQLQAIYNAINLRFVMRTEHIEITALLAGAGVFLLLLGALCSMFWLGRMP
jgi:Ca-activated chloride channel family protein